MKMYILPSLISILLFFSSILSAQTVSVLPAIKDNSMFNESGTKSLGAGKLFAGQTCQGNIRRALIQFDLSAIPSDATVTNVELKLGAEKSRGMGDGIIDVYAVTQDWGEGTSDASGGGGNGATAIAPDATWTDAMLGTASWSTPGGDFDPSLLTSRVTTEEFQTISFPSSQNFATQVEAWAANPSSNFGILIVGVEGTDCSAYRFGARDDGTAPELVVTWESGCEPSFTNIFVQSCDTYTTGGGFVLDESGTFTESLVDENGCDSIVTIELTILESSELLIDGTLCEGQSFTLEGIVFDQNNPSGEVLYQAVNGCDSIVMIDLEFEPSTVVNIIETLCDGGSLVVDGVIYNNLNSTGTVLLEGANGCDSIINILLDFYPPSMGSETYIGCEGDGYSVVVNGIIYDESNPSGVEVLEAIDVNGCDSTVVIDLFFGAFIEVAETYNGCQGDGYSITVDNNVFDEDNPSGTVTLTRTNGCDSIVMVDLSFATLPNAGTPTGPIDICNDNSPIVDLNTLLIGADPGGVWTETSSTLSSGFAGNQFDGNGQLAATYIFRYTVSSTTCGEDFSEVFITVAAPNTASVIPSVTICNNNDNGNSSLLNFNDLVTGGFVNGVWMDTDGVGVNLTDLNSVDFIGIPAATYVFSYTTTSNSGCSSEIYTTLVTVEDCICPSIMTSENYLGCEGDTYEVIVNGVVYNESNPTGIEMMTSFNTGCDSIVTVDLSFSPIATGSEEFRTCDTSTPPTFMDTIVNGAINGCDSVIFFTTVYLPTDMIDLVATSCNSDDVGVETFTFTNTSGCDSIITITTEFLPTDSTNLFLTSCNPADTGTFVTTLVNMVGCDSVVTTTTTFEPIDNGVTVVDVEITANLSGAEYQWVDCDNNNAPIPGETEQSFIPVFQGTYGVMITQNGCTVMSECNFIIVLSTEDEWFKDQISITPNPTSGDVRLNFGDLENLNVRILDLTGRVIDAKQNLRGGAEDLRIEGSSGVYFLEVEMEGVRAWLKVVKIGN